MKQAKSIGDSVLALFEYDESSPTCLRYAKEIRSGRDGRILLRAKGDIAGSFVVKSKSKIPARVVVGVKRKGYSAHRIIWQMFNGEIPQGMVIDHLDGNPWNNKIENLQCKTIRANNQNRGAHYESNTGISGVSWSIDRGNLYARAICYFDNKRRSKAWSVKKYGIIPAMCYAIRWRRNMIQNAKNHGEDYTIRSVGGM